MKESIKLLGIPGPVHIGLAQAKITLRQNTIKHAVIVHLDIPRVGSIHRYPGLGQECGQGVARSSYRRRTGVRRKRRYGLGDLIILHATP
ncbi:hypothetical protein G6F55_014069 [Rhizopus delemar]|nr:hypothetical protein G6F55_014069 [Rhizopus delemar]